MAKCYSNSNKKAVKRSVESKDDKQTTRKSTRSHTKRKSLSIQSPNAQNSCPTNATSSVSRDESLSLSQYFPNRKGSQSSPRNQSNLSLKYTRLKSPNGRFVKKLNESLSENLITYGETSFDESVSQSDTRTPVPIDTSIATKETTNKEKGVVDYRQIWNDFLSVMDRVSDEEMEQNREEVNDCYQQLNSDSDFENDCIRPSISCLSLNTNSNETIDYKPNIGSKPNEQMDSFETNIPTKVAFDVKNVAQSCELNRIQTQNPNPNCECDFDDSLDDVLCEMEFQFPNANNESVDNRRVVTEEDDGFESDGSFERMVSQMPNEELIKQTKRCDSGLETSELNASIRSTGSLLTLSEIIELINKD